MPDVETTAAAVPEHGGRITLPKMALPKIGWMIKFDDPEGNVVCAMQYDETAE